MKRWIQFLFLVGLFLFLASSASAQGSFFSGIAWRYTPAGAFPASGATITVCTSTATGTPCTPTISLFADAALSVPVSNPLPVCSTSPQFGCIDGLGNFSFYASTTGPYTYTATGAGLSPYGPIPITASLNPASNINFTGTINCTIINVLRCISPSNPQGWAGSDIGGWVNSASSNCVASGNSTCVIQIAAGDYNTATQWGIAGGITLEGAGPVATQINWTGSGSGVMVSENNGSNNWTIRDLMLTTTVGGTATALKIINNQNTLLDNVIITAGGNTTGQALNGFGTAIAITGDGVSAISFNNQLRNVQLYNYTVAGISADHAGGLSVTDSSFYTRGNSTAVNILLDSGITGAVFDNVQTGNGLHGGVARCTISCGAVGTYNAPPWGVFFNSALFDSQTGGDGFVFDSTLGAKVVDFRFTNSWIASSTGYGLHISGGQKISWTAGGTIRGATKDGVLIDNANVKDILIADSFITNNDTSNIAANGVTVSAAATNIRIMNNRIGDTTEPFSAGFQRFGIAVTANATDFQAQGNDLNGNVTGPFSSSSTAEILVINNTPLSHPAGSYGIYAAGVNGSGAGNYSGANTGLASVDTTYLCLGITVPVGWKLMVTASFIAESLTAAVTQEFALVDAGVSCTSGGNTALAGSERIVIPPAANALNVGIAMSYVLIGDGANHSISIAAATTNAADDWGINNTSVSASPSMIFQLTPSN